MISRFQAALIAAGALTALLPALAMWTPAALSPTPAFAEANQVIFPPLDDLVHYTTVNRGQTREHMLTNRNALDAIKAGKLVRTGTHIGGNLNFRSPWRWPAFKHYTVQTVPQHRRETSSTRQLSNFNFSICEYKNIARLGPDDRTPVPFPATRSSGYSKLPQKAARREIQGQIEVAANPFCLQFSPLASSC